MNSLLAHARSFAFGLFVGLLAVAMIWIVARRPEGEPVILLPPAPTATPAPVRVHVTGEVAAPGVYELSPGSIAQDAIAAAGGATAEGDPNRLNLAAPLSDGQQIVVPNVATPVVAAHAESADVSGGVAAPLSASNKININTASAVELEALPEIGPVTAARIVEYRTANGRFRRIEDITDVRGIGPATFEAIKDLITVGSP